MDPLSLVPLARTLVDIDSTTGQEADCGRWLAAYLRGRGFRVEEQPVSGDRFNVLATLDSPRVVFSTHFDCVPPFFPSRETDRGAARAGCVRREGHPRCPDLRARAAAAAGARDVGALFVVGEERGSDGARARQRSRRTRVAS